MGSLVENVYVVTSDRDLPIRGGTSAIL